MSLVSGDGQHIKAQKVILTASTPFCGRKTPPRGFLQFLRGGAKPTLLRGKNERLIKAPQGEIRLL